MAKDAGAGNGGTGAGGRAGGRAGAGRGGAGRAQAGRGDIVRAGDGRAEPARPDPARPASARPDSARPEAARHIYGPRPLGALLPALTRPAFRRRSPAAAQILTDWTAIVGPQLAATTLPRRLSGSTLTIACSGPVALELQHLAVALTGRINAHCGQVVVEQLRFVQEPLPPPPPAPAPAPLGPVPALPGVREGELHAALASLGRVVAGRGRA